MKKKIEEVKEEKVEVVHAIPTVHPNPHQDPVCDGCGKPINTVQVREDGKQFHNQYCLNDYHTINR